jgi:hypothetical protein
VKHSLESIQSRANGSYFHQHIRPVITASKQSAPAIFTLRSSHDHHQSIKLASKLGNTHRREGPARITSLSYKNFPDSYLISL